MSPVLYFDRKLKNGDADACCIISNNYQGGFLAGRDLLKSGCRPLAAMTPRYLYSNHRERLHGFLDALQQGSIQQDFVYHIKVSGFTIFHGCRAAVHILEETNCDSIFK